MTLAIPSGGQPLTAAHRGGHEVHPARHRGEKRRDRVRHHSTLAGVALLAMRSTGEFAIFRQVMRTWPVGREG